MVFLPLHIETLCAVANALSTPPGEYGRKVKTQGN